MYIKGTEGDVNPTVSCISIPVYGGLAQQDATTLGFSLYGGFPGSKIQLMNEMLTFIPTSGINQAVSPVTPGVSGLASPTPTPTPTPTALSPSASLDNDPHSTTSSIQSYQGRTRHNICNSGLAPHLHVHESTCQQEII